MRYKGKGIYGLLGFESQLIGKVDIIQLMTIDEKIR